MKKGIFFLFASFIFAYEIPVINGIKEKIELKELNKYAYTAYIKPTFDSQREKYQFVFISKIKDLYCPFCKKLVFKSSKNETISFNSQEIAKKNIIFAYKKNSVKILYLNNKNPLKEMYKVKKIICK